MGKQTPGGGSSLGSRMSSLAGRTSGGTNYFEANFSSLLIEIEDEEEKE